MIANVKPGLFFVLLFVALTRFGTAEEPVRYLYQFDQPAAAAGWKSVNDGVMGGRSEGRFQIGEDNTLDFSGNLSLENNGGFASVRSGKKNLDLRAGDVLVARVRGDGRQYAWNLHVPTWRIAFAYRAFFDTRKDEWIEVRTPLSKFVATSFGREQPNRMLTPSKVNGLGIILADKQAGLFELEIEWIGVERAE